MKRILFSTCLFIFSIVQVFSQTFTLSTQPNIASTSTRSVAVGDINNDGLIDVAVTNSTNAGYYLNSSTGLSGYVQLSSTQSSPGLLGIALFDFESDGDLDLVFGNSDQERFWENNGSSPFYTNGINLGFTGSVNIYLEASDLNNDGNIDLLFSDADRFRVAQNNGSQTSIPFGQFDNIAIGDTRHAVADDLDGDGDIDILLAKLAGTSNQILESNSSTSLSFNGTVSVTSSSNLDCRRIAIADLDMDGNKDFISAYRDNQVDVISYGKGGSLSDGAANFDEVALGTPNGTRDVEVFDFNFDGLPDILVVGEGGFAELYKNDGNRSFTLEQSFNLSTTNDVFDAAVGDFDNNGSPDIYFGIRDDIDQVWLNSTPEPFPVTLSSTESNPTQNRNIQIALTAQNDVTPPSDDDFIVENAVIDSIWLERQTAGNPGAIDITNAVAIAVDDIGNLYFLSPGGTNSFDLKVSDRVNTPATITTISGPSPVIHDMKVSNDNILHVLTSNTSSNTGYEILRFDIDNNYIQSTPIPITGTPNAFDISSSNNIGFLSGGTINIIDVTGTLINNSIVSGSLGYFFFDSDDRLITVYRINSDEDTRLRVYNGDTYALEFEFILQDLYSEHVTLDADNNLYITEDLAGTVRNNTFDNAIYKIDYQQQSLVKIASADFALDPTNYFIGDLEASPGGKVAFLGGAASPGLFDFDQKSIKLSVEALLQGEVKVSLSANKIKSGQASNKSSNEFSIFYDSIPSVTVSSSATAPAAASFEVTIDFTEPMTGFELSDITVSGGTLSEFTEVTAGESYTVLVTPTAQGTLNLDVAAGVAVDADNNPNLAATQFSISADPMSVSISTTDATCFGGNATALATVSGGTSPYQYRWTGPNNSSGPNFIPNFDLFTDVIPGDTYTLEVRDSNGYIISESVGPVSEPAEITYTVTSTDAECNGENGTISISATGGTGALEYTINYNATNPTWIDVAKDTTNLPPGTYNLRVRDANGCLKPDAGAESITITEPAPSLTPSVTGSSTTYGQLSTTGLVISPDVADQVTTHYQISNVVGGVLYQNDGSTTINEGDFITLAQGSAGLVFSPSSGANGSFDIQAAASDRAGCLAGNVVSAAVTVSKAELTVTADDKTKTYGDQNPGLTKTYTGFVGNDTEAEFNEIPSVNTTVNASTATGTYDINLAGGESTKYNFTLVKGTFTVTPAELTVTANDKTITFGDALPALDGTLEGVVNNDNITASYATAANASSNAGVYAITATLNDPDTRLANYNVSSTDGTLTINKAAALISFDAIADVDFANATTVNLTATSNSPETITFTLDQGDGSLNGNVLTLNSTGTFTVTASQAEGTNYLAATPVSRTFNVTDSRKSDQTITFTDDLTGLTYGDAAISLSATASSNLAVIYTTTGPVTIDGSTLTITGAGDATVTAQQGGNGDFNPAPPVTQSFTISKATLSVTADDQQITFGDALPAFTVTYAGFVGSDDETVIDTTPIATTTATATSDAGTYPITASGGVDDNYSFDYTAGTLTINKADQAISFMQGDVDISASPVTLQASSTSNLPVSFNVVSGPATVSGDVLTLSNTGTVVVEAIQGGNINYNAASPVSVSFNVTDASKQDQTITFANIADAIYGDQIILSATASSGLTVDFTIVSGMGTLSNGTLTLEGVGTFEVRATQSGDGTYNPAPAVTQTFTVSKASLTVTADDKQINEGEAIPALTISYAGFVLGEDASVIDVVPAISTTATPTSQPGTYPITLSGGSDDLYELTLVDGTLTIEEVLGTEEETLVEVYPNPVTEVLHVRGSLQSIKLVDMRGNILMTLGRETNVMIDMSGYSAGSYQLLLTNEKGQEINRKIIKE